MMHKWQPERPKWEGIVLQSSQALLNAKQLFTQRKEIVWDAGEGKLLLIKIIFG